MVSIISLSDLLKPLSYCVEGVILAKKSADNVKMNTKLTKYLYSRCCDIAEDLEQIDPILYKTGRAQKLLEQIELSEKLCIEYEKRWKITKFILSGSYRKKFNDKHLYISFYFNDLVNSAMLTKNFPNNINFTKNDDIIEIF